MADNDAEIILRAVDQASNALAAVRRQLEQMDAATKKADASLKNVEKTTKQTAQGFLNLGRIADTAIGTFAGNAAMKGLDRLQDLAFGAIKTGISFNAMKEQAEIAFGSMLKDGTAGKAMLADLYQFAARTPFSFESVTEASKRLLAYGFAARDVKSILTDLGDASAGLGLGAEGIQRLTVALGQMQAKGRVMTQEMNQITETGVNAWALLANSMNQSVGKTMKDVENGAVSADRAISVLRAGMRSQFGGMMEDQSRTFNGMLSTLSDMFKMASGQVLEPFFLLAKSEMESLIGKFGSENWQANLNSLELKMFDVADAIKAAADQALDLVQKLASLADAKVFGIPLFKSSAIRIDEHGIRVIEGNGSLIPGISNRSGNESTPAKPYDPSVMSDSQMRRNELKYEVDYERRKKLGQLSEDEIMIHEQQSIATSRAIEMARGVTATFGGLEDAGKKAKKEVDILADGIITFAEALENNLTASQAGVMEAIYNATRKADEEAFDFEKTMSKLAHSFQLGAQYGNKMFMGMARNSMDKTESAFSSLMGMPSRESAMLSAKLASVDLAIAQQTQANRPALAALETYRSSVDSDIELMERSIDALTRAARQQTEEIDRQTKSLQDQRTGLGRSLRDLRPGQEGTRRYLQGQLDTIDDQLSALGNAKSDKDKQIDAIKQEIESRQRFADSLDKQAETLKEPLGTLRQSYADQLEIITLNNSILKNNFDLANALLPTEQQRLDLGTRLIDQYAQETSVISQFNEKMGLTLLPEIDDAAKAHHDLAEAARRATGELYGLRDAGLMPTIAPVNQIASA